MVAIEKLDNGLTLVVENIPHVESAAYELLIPGGIIFDREERVGSSLLLAEMTTRGAGGMNSRELSNAFEEGGIRHGESASSNRFSYRGALLKDKLEQALSLVAKMVCEPEFPEEQLESVKAIYLQDLLALKDNPSRRCLMALGSSYYPEPFNRPSLGDESGIKTATVQELREDWERSYRPDGAILAVAGNVVEQEVIELIAKYFGQWKGSGLGRPQFPGLPERRKEHIPEEAAQMQIALAYPSAPFDTEHYYAAKVATGLLSGGMFGRLFIEVREKQGLCYSVYARHASALEYGTITGYAGTTPDRADRTLKTMVEVLSGIAGTVTDEELERAKANIISSIVIGEESPGARAVSNAIDYWLIGRVRPLDEIHNAVTSVQQKDIDKYLEAYPVDNIAITTLGSRELDWSGF